MKVSKIAHRKDVPVANIEVTQDELDFLRALVAQVIAQERVGSTTAYDMFVALGDAGGKHERVQLTESNNVSVRTSIPLLYVNFKS